MKGINTEGSLTPIALYKWMKDFKQGRILERGLFKCSVDFTKTDQELTSDLKEEIFYNRLKLYMLEHLMQNITITKEDNRYLTEVFIVELDDLKHMVEYCVRNMPIDVINQIRDAKSPY